MGHIIDKEGLHKDKAKVEAIVNAPRPVDITGVRAFVGLVNYYSKFVQNLSDVLSLFTNYYGGRINLSGLEIVTVPF